MNLVQKRVLGVRYSPPSHTHTSSFILSTNAPPLQSSIPSTPTNQSGEGTILETKDTLERRPSTNSLVDVRPRPLSSLGAANTSRTDSSPSPSWRPSQSLEVRRPLPVSAKLFSPLPAGRPTWNRWCAAEWEKPDEGEKGSKNRLCHTHKSFVLGHCHPFHCINPNKNGNGKKKIFS